MVINSVTNLVSVETLFDRVSSKTKKKRSLERKEKRPEGVIGLAWESSGPKIR